MHSSQSTSFGQPFTRAGGTQSNAPRVPPGRLLRVVQGVLDVMFGAPDDDATATGMAGAGGHDNVQVDLRPARTPRGELLLNALSQAIAEYHYTFLRPYRRYSPEFTFQLHQVCLVRTPDNMALLAEFDRWREVMLRAEEIAELSSDTVLALGAALMEKSDWANDSFQQGRKYNAALDRALEHIDRFNSRFGKSKEGNETDTPPAPLPEAAG